MTSVVPSLLCRLSRRYFSPGQTKESSFYCVQLRGRNGIRGALHETSVQGTMLVPGNNHRNQIEANQFICSLEASVCPSIKQPRRLRLRLNPIPPQPASWISYFRSGRLLYTSLGLFLLESFVYWILLERAYNSGDLLWFGIWLWSFGFSFVHIFLVLADGWSRYQNYKRVKDQLFLFGFNTKIFAPYMGSKCQRLAVLTAAEELGMEQEVKQYFYDQGYRWYHWVPQFMVKDPLFFFQRYFWSRTFLERQYSPRVDFRKLPKQVRTA